MSFNKTFTGDVLNANGGTALAFRSFSAKSILANATNSSGIPTELAGSAAFQYPRVNSANNALEWATLSGHASTSILYTSDQFQREALTGAITASANSNTTAFGALAAKSVLANATNASAVPAALAGSAAFQHLRVNSANTGLEWATISTGDFPNNSVPLTALATQATDTLVANITAGTATPTAVAFTTIDSTSLPWDATTHTFQRAALTGAITASQDSNTTAFGALAAKSVLANSTNASAVPAALAGSAAFQHLRVNSANTGLEWSVLTTGDFPSNSVPLTALATQAADTFVGNITTGTATPVAVALSSIDSTSIIYDATSHTFQVAAASGGHITKAQNSNTYTISNSVITPAMDVARVEINEAGAGPFNDYATGNLDNADLLIVTSGATQTYTGFAAPSQDGRKFRMLVGSTSVVTIAHLSASSVSTNRVGCPSNTDLICQPRTMLEFDYANTTWRVAVVSAQLPVYETTTGLDITAAAASTITTTTGNLTLSTSAAGSRVVVSGADDVLIEAVADDVFINSAGETRVTPGTLMTISGANAFLRMDEQAGSTPSVAAGTGLYWVRNDTPSNPMFTDDTNVDHLLLTQDDLEATVMTWSVTENFLADLYTAGQFFFDGIVSPTALGSTTNNWAPPITQKTNIRASASVASAQVTGLAGGSSGRFLMLHNIGTANNIVLMHNNASSSAGNKFFLPNTTNFSISPGVGVILWYDDASSFWRTVGAT